MQKVVLALLLTATPVLAEDVFSPQEHCVAWKTRKTMMLVRKLEPVGKNCSPQATLEQQGEDLWRFAGRFAINQFSSGEPDRDKEVVKILHGEQQPELVFTSDNLSKSQWRKIFTEKLETILPGTLLLGGNSYPIQPRFTVSDDGLSVRGLWVGKFSDLKIEVPSVAGGLVAKVDDHLELHFRLQIAQIKNAQTVLAP